MGYSWTIRVEARTEAGKPLVMMDQTMTERPLKELKESWELLANYIAELEAKEKP